MMSGSFCKYEQERERLRESIEKKNTRIKKALDACLVQFRSDEGDTLINIQQFGNLTLGERFYVNKGIYFIPVEYGVSTWVFYTVIEPGYFFGFHEHNVPEVCKVIAGVLVNQKDGKEYQPGQIASWDKFTLHKPGAKVNGGVLELLVIFDITGIEGTDNVTPAT